MALFTITTTAAASLPPNQLGTLTITIPHAGIKTFALNDFTTNGAPDYSHPQGHSLSKIKISVLTNVGGLFALNGTAITAAQEITVADIASGLLVFNDNGSTSAAHTSSFTYFASDDVSNTFSTVLGTINVNTLIEVNDPPIIGDGAETLPYGLTLTFTAAMFTTETTPAYSDAESDNADKLRITSIPTNGTIKYKGKPITLNREVTFADITSGYLTFIGPTGFTGFGSGSFTFEIADSAGTYSDVNTNL